MGAGDTSRSATSPRRRAHGTPDDFAYFVDYLHRHGIGVILDWVPAHFPNDVHGLGYFDGTHLYEHSDPRLGEHRDWGTKIFNYGRAEVRNFLFGNALFWLDRYHIDGLRVDAVASMLYLDYSRKPGEWVPNMFGGNENLEAIDFLKRLNEICHREHPGILTIAEESTSWSGVSRPTYLGGLGFSLKWNMGWMNDTLRYISKDPVYRKYEHGSLTFSMIYAFSENFILPLSHDEVVHGKGSLLDKMPGRPLAEIRQPPAALRATCTATPARSCSSWGRRSPSGANGTTTRASTGTCSSGATTRGSSSSSCDLNALYEEQPSLHQVDFDWQGYEWLELHDWENSVVAFLRRARNPNDAMVVVCNFTPVVREQLPDRRADGRLLSRGPQHRRRISTAARTWATRVVRGPCRSRTPAGRSICRSACLPWASCSSRRRRGRDGNGHRRESQTSPRAVARSADPATTLTRHELFERLERPRLGRPALGRRTRLLESRECGRPGGSARRSRHPR